MAAFEGNSGAGKGAIAEKVDEILRLGGITF